MNFWGVFRQGLWGFVFIGYLMVLFQVMAGILHGRGLRGWARAGWLVALFVASPGAITAAEYDLLTSKVLG